MIEQPVHLKRWLINGIVIVVPLVITLIIFLVVLEFILGVLSPLAWALVYFWPDEPPMLVVELATLVGLVVVVILIGFAAEHTPGDRILGFVDGVFSAVPGVGMIYDGVRQVSELLAGDGSDQFKEVKLVEFPHQDAYVLGFLTGDTPEAIEDTVGGGEMVTVMVPLGPNPTTNGFILHMPVERVYDVELSVEEAVQSIATLGVATEQTDEPNP